jgi:integrase
MSASARLTPPCNGSPEPLATEATLGTVIHAYLDHLSLRSQIGNLSPDHLANVSRTLRQFATAWRVSFADGRQAIVPGPYESRPVGRPRRDGTVKPHGRPRGPKRAATPGQAIKLARTSVPGPVPTCSASATSNGEWPVARASNDDLVRWIIANPQWKSGHAKTNNLRHISDCFLWWEDETGTRPPFRWRRLPKFTKETRREATAAEYVALMRHTSTPELRRALWCLWNVQGMRTCELRELQWTDFNWEGAFILLRKHKTALKTGKPRLIPLTARQLRFFRGLFRSKAESAEHVFLNTQGDPWTRRSLSKHLRTTAKRIGIDEGVADRVSAYCLRHSFATQADEAGCDQSQTAMLMGHSGPEMLRDVYSKASRKVEHSRKAAETVERLRRETRRRGNAGTAESLNSSSPVPRAGNAGPDDR